MWINCFVLLINEHFDGLKMWLLINQGAYIYIFKKPNYFVMPF